MISKQTVRLLSVFLSLLVVIGVVILNKESVSAIADSATGLTYTISGGVVTITGFTAPAGFSGNLVIPATLAGATVTIISSSALNNHTELTSISIPSGITSIDEEMFIGCSHLEAININSANSSYQSIDDVLFSKDGTILLFCPEGKTGSFTIPSGVTDIWYGAFEHCRNLTNITIPSSVIEILMYAFSDCDGLTSITIPSSVTYFGQGVFFDSDGLTSISIPSSVTSIGSKTFKDCSGLSSVAITYGVTSIGDYAFENCTSLTDITIPGSMTSIEVTAFWGCTSMTAINVDVASSTYKSINGLLLSKDGTQLFCCPAGKTGNLTIPSGVTNIETRSCASCLKITSITVPSSVTGIRELAFYGCTNLSAVYFSGNAPTLGNNVFYGCASGFTVYYLSSKTGFSNPWYGYTTATFSTSGVSYRTHVQDVGWQEYVSDGAVSGTSAQSKRLEAINIKMDLDGITGGIEYRTHVQDIGWQDWVANDALSGTSGQSKRLEAIQIRLTGEVANTYDVYYRVHAQNVGWMGWAKNGESSGTAGHSYRLEAIEIKLVEKGDPAPGSTAWSFMDKYEPVGALSYKTHVQDVGWQDYVSNGATAGTSGESKRLEGIQIKLNGIAGGIEYRTHVQDYGWMDWVGNDAMSGTSGQSKRLEAIQIRLTGAAADTYDLYYCVHAENTGWLDWAKNGEAAGTAGFGYRLEAIQIVLVPKGGPAPGPRVRAFVQG